MLNWDSEKEPSSRKVRVSGLEVNWYTVLVMPWLSLWVWSSTCYALLNPR